jgi:hypothetical protein
MTHLKEIGYLLDDFEIQIIDTLDSWDKSLQDYKKIRQDYISQNTYLHLFSIPPRQFGEKWGQGFIKSLDSDFILPSNTHDLSFSGEYDLLLPYNNKFIKVEVKASRATEYQTDGDAFTKALDSKTHKKFDMNFQQMKPDLADVFVWIAVWVDQIQLWVLSGKEIKQNRYFNDKQHRGNVVEGQLHIKHNNIKDFDQYLTKPENLKKAIIKKFLN